MNIACQILKIDVPQLEKVRDHREAGPFSLFIVALLESGEPMTLEQAASRFEEAGVAPFKKALLSLKRCRPGRAPIYRNGDLYSLDPYDDELDLWVFRLGLRPPRAKRAEVEEAPSAPLPEPEPVPGLDVPVTAAELEEAFTKANLLPWSRQRLACLLVEAHGEPMHRAEASAWLSGIARCHDLRPDWPNRWTNGGVREDKEGYWTLYPEHPQVKSAREALRKLLEQVRAERPHRAAQEEQFEKITADYEKRQDEKRQALEALRRCLLHAVPQAKPAWVVRLDLATRDVKYFKQADFSALRADLESFDWIGALEVRPLLDALGIDVGMRHLAELGPPQKTFAIPGRRPLKITAEAMIRGCSNVTKPLGDQRKMLLHLDQGKELLLKRQLRKAIRSLYGLYHYCKLHRAARVTRGDVEAFIPVPWVRWAEWSLYKLKQQALKHNLEVEAVYGPYLSLENPWRGSSRLRPMPDGGRDLLLVTEHGHIIHDWMILGARLAPADAEANGWVH